jgi:hypothetical protein
MIMNNDRLDYFLALLYYFGYLTIDYNTTSNKMTVFQIPNEYLYQQFLLYTDQNKNDII